MAIYGKYYDAVNSGNVYLGLTAAAGTTIPLASGTAMTFGVWNISSTHNVVLLKLNAVFTSGTIAIGGFGITAMSAGQAIGTPISAFTDGVFGTTIFNAKLGWGAPRARFTPSAATIAASTSKYWTGIGFTTAATDGPALHFSHDFDGSLILPPGWAGFLSASIAQTGLLSPTIMWAEVPA